MPQLVAVKACRHFGRPISPGDKFEVLPREARTYKALGWATDVPVEKKPKSSKTSDQEGKAGEYQRRDMRAEG